MKKEHLNLFGKVSGQERGDGNLIDPPISRKDDYFWLRDESRTNKDVQDIITNENEYIDSFLDSTQTLQKDIFQEIKSRTKEDDDTIPYHCGEGGMQSQYKYFTRTYEGKGYISHWRQNLLTKTDELLLDENALAEGKDHCDVSNVTVSHDHQKLLYEVSWKGDEIYDVVVNDIAVSTDSKVTLTPLEHTIPKLFFGGVEWCIDNNRLFYTTHNEATKNFDKVWVYDLTTKETKLIHEDNDLNFNVYSHSSDDDNFLFVGSASTDCNELYVIPLNDLTYSKTLIHRRTDHLKYYFSEHEDRFVILTNWQAENFRVMWCPKDISRVSQDNWVELFPYNPAHFTKSLSTFKHYLYLTIKENGLNKVFISVLNKEDSVGSQLTSQSKYSYSTPEQIPIEFEVYDQYTAANCVYDTTVCRYGFYTPITPSRTYEYDISSRHTTLLKEKEVPDYSSDKYAVKREFVDSMYGAKVPVTIVWNKEVTNLDTPNYVRLYGYGAYGSSTPVYLNVKNVSLLDRGIVCVTAHVRGSSDMGYGWYQDGKMYNKMNTFNDFNNVAQWLYQSGLTEKGKLMCEGRSAGGLLVGACMVLRPDLYHAVFLGVPFVDLLNTMADSSIPLTVAEWTQWGNPNTREGYHYMNQYCPYYNVRPDVVYPHSLINCGYHDQRVNYWESLKFHLKVRECEYKAKEQAKGKESKMETAEEHDPKLHHYLCDLSEGHFGGSDKYKSWREDAKIMAWILKIFGIAE